MPNHRCRFAQSNSIRWLLDKDVIILTLKQQMYSYPSLFDRSFFWSKNMTLDTSKFDVVTYSFYRIVVQFSRKCQSLTSVIKRSSINVRMERHLIFLIFRVLKNRPKSYQRTISLSHFFLHWNVSWFPPSYDVFVYLKLRLCQVCPLLFERQSLSPNQFGFHGESVPNEYRLLKLPSFS